MRNQKIVVIKMYKISDCSRTKKKNEMILCILDICNISNKKIEFHIKYKFLEFLSKNLFSYHEQKCELQKFESLVIKALQFLFYFQKNFLILGFSSVWFVLYVFIEYHSKFLGLRKIFLWHFF